jgi:hypothetical protein
MKSVTKILLASLLAASGCVAIDDFSMFYVSDGGTDTGVSDSSPTDADATPDAPPIDGCVIAAETCNGFDDDCDGTVDEEPTGAGGDRYNCGECGNACGLVADCVDGSCADSSLDWTALAESPVTAFTLAVDMTGDRVVLAGRFLNEITVSDSPEIGSTAAGFRLYVARVEASTGAPVWVATDDAGDFNTVQTVTHATTGETYVTGEVASLLTIDGRTVTTPDSTLSVFLWALDEGGVTSGLDILQSVDGTVRSVDSGVSSDGTLYIAGNFTGTFTFGTASATSAGGRDMFIAKRTAAGVTSIFTFGSEGEEAIYAMDVEAAGGVVVAADYQNTFTMGTTTLPAPSGAVDGIVAAIDPTGDVRWVHTAGGPLADWVQGVAVDEDRNVYFMSAFPKEMDGSGGLNAASFDTTGLIDADVVICSFDTAGTLRWARVTEVGESFWATDFGGAPVLRHRFAPMSAGGGRLYVAPGIAGGESIDERSVIGTTFSSSVGLIAFSTADGSFDWAHSFGATNAFGVFDVAASDSAVVIGGRFRDVATIGLESFTSPTGGWTGFVTHVVSP